MGKKQGKEKNNKPLEVIFYGPDEKFNLDNADAFFNDESEIINKTTTHISKAYKKMKFLMELICFLHGDAKNFDISVVNNFAAEYPEILTITKNEHIYNMNYLLILLYKYGACRIEDDGQIVIDNSIFFDLCKFYKRKLKLIKIYLKRYANDKNEKTPFVFLCLKENKRKKVTVKAGCAKEAKLKLLISGYKVAAYLEDK